MSAQHNTLVTDSRLLTPSVPRPKLQGYQRVSYVQVQPQSVTSSGISFICPRRQQGLDLDRSIKIVVPIRLTLTATDVPYGSLLLNANYSNFRSWPFQRACQRMQMFINSTEFNFECAEVFTALEHLSTTMTLRNLQFSTCPTYPSGQSQSFNDLAGGNRSPLATYADSIDGVPVQNYPFQIVSQTNDALLGGVGTAITIVDMVTIEYLRFPPLYFGPLAKNYGSLRNVKDFEMNFTLQNNAGFRMISIDNVGAQLGSGTISVTSQFQFSPADNFSYDDKYPKLLMTYLQPEGIPIDSPEIEIPYFNIQQYKSQASAAMTGGSTSIISSNDILTPMIPTKILVFAKKPQSVFLRDPYTPDVFCAIKTMRVVWNNQIVMDNIHPSVLYDLSQASGIQYEWASWSGLGLNNATAGSNFGKPDYQFGGIGSVACFDVLDFGITLEQQRALSSQMYHLQMDVTVKNIATDTFTPELFVLLLIDGCLYIAENGQAKKLDNIQNFEFSPFNPDKTYFKALKFNPGKKIDVPMLVKQGSKYKTI